MKVLVCGGRDYGDINYVVGVLDTIHTVEGPISAIIHGNAPGADTIAGAWAMSRDVEMEVFPAHWDLHGRAAGPIRNKQMLEEGGPDLVVAFPGGRGTDNMVKLAGNAGVSVIHFAGVSGRPATKDTPS